MASSRQQRRPGQDAKLDQDLEQVQKQEADQELFHSEVGADQFSGLQNTVGNASLNTLLADSGRGAADLALEGQDEEQEEVQEVEEEAGQDMDEAFSDLMGAMGARESMVASADTEDWQMLFGGDPDDEPPPQRAEARKLRAFLPEIESMADQVEREAAPLEEESVPELDLPPLSPARSPRGDERLEALWAWLRDPRAAVDAHFSPERLAEDAGPLERCNTLGRFVATAAPTALARGLGSLARPLPGGSGMAPQVARAAAMAELACLCLPVDVAVANRTAAIALEDDAPLHARAAARRCMQERRLRADRVVTTALEGEQPPQVAPIPEPGETGENLLAAALRHAAGLAPIPDPRPRARAPGQDSTADASTAEIDALLNQMTGAAPVSGRLGFEHVQPVLESADQLMLLAGRTQVELGAAGVALTRAAGAGVVTGTGHLLRAADRELVEIARTVAQEAQLVERLVGDDLEQADGDLSDCETNLRQLARRLRRVREAAVDALGRRHLA